ncbi:MAG: ribosome silencing factor [Prevotellaceae bacterium]|nr:ribosome silencing factor [Prevotella sp.]MDD7258346.1 ribosome silencing factor [Prevotellaceae bacterium]MDY6129904.1 ribosome silencing factor [Prevotella sp.]
MIKTKDLVETITKGIQEKKGQNIVVADLNNIEGTICNYFVICQGTSPSHVEAITDAVEEYVRVNASEKPVRIIGRENDLWVAMDYSDVLVHIFVPDAREYYNLENLWADAKIETIPDLD